ncbi:L10-interacting MYB domain-containing protein-like [Hordeum vulgare]|nr:L10-interacting MYB domain-containing protein-like [Hordeum vulgare]
MELKNSATGLGWNDKMGTIEADGSWWDIHLKKYPGHAKWRYMGPPNLKEMDVMFENAHVTGETASIPGEISSSSDDDAIAEVKESEDLGTPLKSFKKKGGQGKTLDKYTMLPNVSGLRFYYNINLPRIEEPRFN